jgi:hypothetical protein
VRRLCTNEERDIYGAESDREVIINGTLEDMRGRK